MTVLVSIKVPIHMYVNKNMLKMWQQEQKRNKTCAQHKTII